MKKILLFILLTMFTTMLYAQVPNEMNYSVMLLNPTTGKVMANETAKIRLELRVGSTNGDAVWGQDFEVTTDKSGVVQLVLKFTDDIDWSQGNYFLAMKVNDQEVGCPQMRSVPYAFQADRLSGIVTHEELVGTWRTGKYYYGQIMSPNIYVLNTDGTGYMYHADEPDISHENLNWSIDNRGVLLITTKNEYSCRIVSKKSATELWWDNNIAAKQ